MMNCHFDTQLKIIQAKPNRMSSHRVLHDHLLEFEAYSDPNLNNPYEKIGLCYFSKKSLQKMDLQSFKIGKD